MISRLRDLFLFPQMKKILTGKRFADEKEVKQKMAEELKGIKIDGLKIFHAVKRTS